MARECKENMKCGSVRICADQHDRRDCKANYKKCVNCDKLAHKSKVNNSDSNHSANDKSCPCYVKMINIRISKTNYTRI